MSIYCLIFYKYETMLNSLQLCWLKPKTSWYHLYKVIKASLDNCFLFTWLSPFQTNKRGVFKKGGVHCKKMSSSGERRIFKQFLILRVNALFAHSLWTRYYICLFFISSIWYQVSGAVSWDPVVSKTCKNWANKPCDPLNCNLSFSIVNNVFTNHYRLIMISD